MKEVYEELLRQMEMDLSVNAPYIKGHPNPVRNCWHFYTDGNAIDRLFDDREDFKDGMNRVFTVGRKYRLFILAFTLMDTHVHFVIYGDFDECNKFMHEYVRVTSIHIANRHKERHKLRGISISHQKIDNDFYLKSVICYVIKNPPVGGLPFLACDYPWGSGGLYFRSKGLWCSAGWTAVINKEYSDYLNATTIDKLRSTDKYKIFNSRTNDYPKGALLIDGMIFPGEYIAFEFVERLFKTHKSFNYFMCRTKEEDIENIEGIISRLSIPIQELRQYRDEICKELFQAYSTRQLNIEQRIKVAKSLKYKYRSSIKQICKVCGLIYSETKDLL